MSDVVEYIFSDLLEVIIDNRGKTCPITEKGFPLIATNCIKNDGLYPEFINVRYVDDYTYSTWFRGHPKPSDLIFVLKGTPGRVCYTPSPVNFCIAQDMVALRPKKDLVDSKYLLAVLRSKLIQERIESLHVGSLIPHFKKGDFDKLKIPVIENPEKRQFIGNLYFDLSLKIELNNKINQELENLAQTLFKQWFIDFEFPNENGEPYKSSGGEMVESELGEIPKGWEVQSLEDIAELVRGISYRKHELVSKEEGVPFVNLKCFALDGTFRQDGLKYFNGKFKDSHVIQSDDILVAVTDLTQDRLVIGLPIVWQNDDLALPSLDVCIIRPQEKILKDFLLYEFKTHRYKSRIIEFANGSTVLHLSVKGLETYEIGIPSFDLLSQWSEIVKPILKSIGDNVKENQQLTNLRDTLLPKLISGELEVTQTQTIA